METGAGIKRIASTETGCWGCVSVDLRSLPHSTQTSLYFQRPQAKTISEISRVPQARISCPQTIRLKCRKFTKTTKINRIERIHIMCRLSFYTHTSISTVNGNPQAYPSFARNWVLVYTEPESVIGLCFETGQAPNISRERHRNLIISAVRSDETYRRICSAKSPKIVPNRISLHRSVWAIGARNNG